MNLIVITDIFGHTSALNEFVAQFSELYAEISIVAPYAQKDLPFANEEAAYRYFQQHCGLQKLTEKLKSELDASLVPADILGFSVGGSAAWEISAICMPDKIGKVVCFYGSRIREKTAIRPQFPTSLVFPRLETSFALEPLLQTLEKKPDVEVIRTDYLHGFMNKKSANFSETGYRRFSKWFRDLSRAGA